MAASGEQLAASGANSIPTEDDMERPGLRVAPLRVCHGASHLLPVTRAVFAHGVLSPGHRRPMSLALGRIPPARP
jgi:hypothetical protein